MIGCDVGKSTVTAFDPVTGRTSELPNTAEALTAFARGLPRDCLVVCEATGGHEIALLLNTAAAGVPAHRADARKVKAFVRSVGRLAKPSMPAGSPTTAASVTPNCRAGSRRRASAMSCVR